MNGNIYKDVLVNPRHEFIESLYTNTDIKIERIVSQGHVTPRDTWYDQDDDEWVILLTGRACILFENGTRQYFKSGDFVFIPAHKKHRVVWTDPTEQSVWLAFHFRSDSK